MSDGIDCAVPGCGKPATCFGAYEGVKVKSFACDDHCGHGNEDGHCEPVSAPSRSEETGDARSLCPGSGLALRDLSAVMGKGFCSVCDAEVRATLLGNAPSHPAPPACAPVPTKNNHGDAYDWCMTHGRLLRDGRQG